MKQLFLDLIEFLCKSPFTFITFKLCVWKLLEVGEVEPQRPRGTHTGPPACALSRPRPATTWPLLLLLLLILLFLLLLWLLLSWLSLLSLFSLLLRLLLTSRSSLLLRVLLILLSGKLSVLKFFVLPPVLPFPHSLTEYHQQDQKQQNSFQLHFSNMSYLWKLMILSHFLHIQIE